MPLPSTSITKFLELYAASGDMKAADEFMDTFLMGSPNPYQHSQNFDN